MAGAGPAAVPCLVPDKYERLAPDELWTRSRSEMEQLASQAGLYVVEMHDQAENEKNFYNEIFFWVQSS